MSLHLGRPYRFPRGDIIPHFAKNGTALTQEERTSIAKRKGLCVQCAVRTHTITHFIFFYKRSPLTNENVHEGVCIRCNPTSVPAKVLQDWEHRNPRVPVVPPSQPPARRQERKPARSGTLPRLPLPKGMPRKRYEKEAVMRACAQNGFALKSQLMRNDKEFVRQVCAINGLALKYAPDFLRADKEVVLAAVQSRPEALKFALGGLNQDKDCLIKAKLWDENYLDRELRKDDAALQSTRIKIVLSTRFSLAAESSDHATRFTTAIKENPYIESFNFVVYSPNAFNKATCDPNWTDKDWPCRGTHASCQKPSHLKVGVPKERECCWRYSFRYHLLEASRLNGFMIQVVDWDKKTARHTLGDGQQIETEMADDVGIKIFRFYEPNYAYKDQVDRVVSEIQKWYEEGKSNMEECNIRS